MTINERGCCEKRTIESEVLNNGLQEICGGEITSQMDVKATTTINRCEGEAEILRDQMTATTTD